MSSSSFIWKEDDGSLRAVNIDNYLYLYEEKSGRANTLIILFPEIPPVVITNDYVIDRFWKFMRTRQQGEYWT